MLITDDLFYGFIKCKTKGYLLSSTATEDGRPSHPISDWQQHLAEDFKRECRDLLTAINPAGCFMGTPEKHDLANGRHHYIVDPILTFEDMASHLDALERLPVPAEKVRNRYIPIRFISSEKVTKEHKLCLAFDALVLGKLSGQMPISGKLIHGRRKMAMSIKLNELIRSVEILVATMRLTLADSTPPSYGQKLVTA